MKTEITHRIEKEILIRFNDFFNRGITAVLECNLNEQGIVDAISFNQTKNEFTCFEIKVSVQDFHSKAKLSFIGNRNYYAMPLEIYEKVKGEIPNGIGCYALRQSKYSGYYYLECVKKCKPKELDMTKELLLSYMLRSARNKTNLSMFKELTMI